LFFRLASMQCTVKTLAVHHLPDRRGVAPSDLHHEDMLGE
jgi:hypothetical protein